MSHITCHAFRMDTRIWHAYAMPTRRDTSAPASALAFGIASVLNDVRVERRLTGLEMERLTGLDQTQISRWMHAKVDISAVNLLTLCEGLGLDAGEVLKTARRRAAEYELRTSVAESTTPDA